QSNSSLPTSSPMDNNTGIPMRQNYGTYNSNVPMKVFSGQPAYVTVGQFDRLVHKVDDIEHNIHKNIPDVSCGQCPKSMDECNAITDDMKRQNCMSSYDTCQKNN